MRKINLVYVYVLAALFAGCSNNDETTTDDSNKLPKTKGDYTMKTAKVDGSNKGSLKGSINLEKEGEGDMKLSLKDFEYSGSKSKLSVAFTVKLAKITKSNTYAITFAKQDGIDNGNIPLSGSINVSALSGLDLTALSGITELSGLTALSGVDSITLDNKNKQAASTITVDVVKEVDHDGAKVQGAVLMNSADRAEIRIGAKVITMAVITLTANEFLDSVKDAKVKAALKALHNYSGSDAKATAAKTKLQTLITDAIAKLKKDGAVAKDTTLVLTAQK